MTGQHTPSPPIRITITTNLATLPVELTENKLVEKYIVAALTESRMAVEGLLADADKVGAIARAGERLIATLAGGHAIYSCGNGGSMSDAMHFAEELTGRFRETRAGMAATAISDPGHLTCVANDFGYEEVFARYLQARARPGDALVAISTSGRSENVVRAARYAVGHEMTVISLTGGAGSPLGQLAHVDIAALEARYADKIQELHIKILHIFIELIEREFFPANYS